MRPLLSATLSLALAAAITAAPAAAQDSFSLPAAKPTPPPPWVAPPPPEPIRPAVVVHARPTSWLLTADVTGALYEIQQDTSGTHQEGRKGSGSVGATRYLQAVVDDDRSRTLQPFLQRVSSFGVTLSGGGFVTDADGAPRDRTSSHFGASGSAELYLTRFFLFDAGFSYTYSALHDVGVDDGTHSIAGTLGVGVRVGDTRVVASYTLKEDATNGDFIQNLWGPVSLAAFIVIDARVALAPSVFAQEDGGGGGLTISYYPTRSFDVFAGGNGQAGGHYTDGVVFDLFGATGGFTAWVAPTVRLSASYTFTSNHTPRQTVRGLSYGYDEPSHSVSASAAVRLP